MTVDEQNQELFLSVQYPPQVAVYRKTASGDEKPKRLLIGEKTRLSDAHGIAIDTRNKLFLFVNNWATSAITAWPARAGSSLRRSPCMR